MIQNNILNAMDTCVRLTNESSAANKVVKKVDKIFGDYKYFVTLSANI